MRQIGQNFLLTKDKKTAPSAPKEDASVGVATPKIIVPRTIKININGAKSDKNISLNSNFFSNHYQELSLF